MHQQARRGTLARCDLGYSSPRPLLGTQPSSNHSFKVQRYFRSTRGVGELRGERILEGGERRTPMRWDSVKDMNCSIARTLSVVGERWTMLILREAFLGRHRFDEFQNATGIARNILSSRLRDLVRD